MEDYTPQQINCALRHYEQQRKAWSAYNERKREEKRQNGTYRPRGRPRKDTTPPPSNKNELVAVDPI